MDESARACPCLYTTPCHDRCTCVTPLSSSGCHRCCTYGSAEQRTMMAASLAKFIDLGWKTRAEDREELRTLPNMSESSPTFVESLIQLVKEYEHEFPDLVVTLKEAARRINFLENMIVADGAARDQLRERLLRCEGDHDHLKRLYKESREYVGTLERERDDFVETGKRNVTEINRLDAHAEHLEKVLVQTLEGICKKLEAGIWRTSMDAQMAADIVADIHEILAPLKEPL